MVITFTGTRKGMTEAQKEELIGWLERLKPTKVYHGDCIGADTEFHDIVRLKCPKAFIHIYPCDLRDQRSFLHGDKVEQPAFPLERNRTMVDAGDLVIAAPATLDENAKGGTMYTVRYARKVNKKLVILKPEVSKLESLFE